ncbi:hypothetical protein MRB53_000525 [Persea americana]|uniref:Uncharacterized protein n=1 Tax=Persea americana TaxID=3435 RepID=A0ACC2MP35_PERAE|nr:hypothetical protein MRB53_000525 [Persea americana]
MKICCLGRRKGNHAVDESGEISAAHNVRLFSYNELRSATRNFHPTNKIGGGGFGVVYKGILRDETQVAIKSLSAESSQGVREFLTEIQMISTIRHPNLVQLIGCCIEGNNRMLVYEYLENNSLASALLGSKSRRITLHWAQRAAICMGTAHGLAFLHEEAEPHIVHRDIKASNVLLDKDLTPKIGDFGLAKLFPDNVTHISTRVAGTIGRSSTKAAWGEDLMILLEWTWKLREENRLLEIMDPELVEYPAEEVLRFIKVALFCTQAASQQRPSMTQVHDRAAAELKLLCNGMKDCLPKITVIVEEFSLFTFYFEVGSVHTYQPCTAKSQVANTVAVIDLSGGGAAAAG